jgi:hypothetical protein
MPKSYLERITDVLIAEASLPIHTREFRFCEHRRWKSDYCWIIGDKKVLLEVEGGVFSQGRHTRGTGYTQDCEKYNEASLLGYTVLRVTKEHLLNGKAIEWVKRALNVS